MVTKHKCKFCGKLRECREVIINGISRGWWCRKHYVHYLEILDRIKKKHGCDDEEAIRIAERMAREHRRKVLP